MISKELQEIFNDLERRDPDAAKRTVIQGELIDLSLNIARLRKERGWSQRELARRMGTSHPRVNGWEHPIPDMTLRSLERLANVFEVSIRDLFEPRVK